MGPKFGQFIQRYAILSCAMEETTHIRLFLGEFATAIRKYFRAWIRDQGVIVWWNNQRSKISWHCLFKLKKQIENYVCMGNPWNNKVCLDMYIAKHFSFLKNNLLESSRTYFPFFNGSFSPPAVRIRVKHMWTRLRPQIWNADMFKKLPNTVFALLKGLSHEIGEAKGWFGWIWSSKLFKIKFIFNFNVVFTLTFLKMALNHVRFDLEFLSGVGFPGEEFAPGFFWNSRASFPLKLLQRSPERTAPAEI
jgi:hypothetical protein